MECALVWLDQLHSNYLVPQEVTNNLCPVPLPGRSREWPLPFLWHQKQHHCARSKAEDHFLKGKLQPSVQLHCLQNVALAKHPGRGQWKLIYTLSRIKSVLRYYSQRRCVHTDLHWHNCQNKSKQVFVNLGQGISRQVLAYGTTVEETK